MSRTVKLRFHGLMFFHFENLTKCRVGFHTKAEHHKIIVKVGREVVNGNGVDVVGEAHVFPPDVSRKVKHLWLYVADAGDEIKPPESTQVTIERNGPESFDKVMDILECYDTPLRPKWDDVLTPSLHIAAGRFFARTVTDNCKRVNEFAMADLFFAIFQPTDLGLDGRFDRTKREYKDNHPKTLAEIIGVDIKVEDNQRLVLAVGDATKPEQVLSSILPQDGLAILIANLPPRHALLPKEFDRVSHDDEEGEDEEEAHDHSGQNPPPQVNIEEQIKNRLRHSFHFLHYYEAFDNTPSHRCVLLAKIDNLDKKQRREGVRPDPPCKGVRDSLPSIEEPAAPDPEANRSA